MQQAVALVAGAAAIAWFTAPVLALAFLAVLVPIKVYNLIRIDLTK